MYNEEDNTGNAIAVMMMMMLKANLNRPWWSDRMMAKKGGEKEKEKERKEEREGKSRAQQQP